MTRGERHAEAFVELRLVDQPQLHGIDAELDRELVHSGLGGEQSGHRARPAHRRRRAYIAFG